MQPIKNQTVSDSKSITCAYPFFERFFFFFLSVLISSWWHSVFFLLIGFFDHIVLGLMTLNETRLEVFNCTDNFQLIFDCKTQLFVVLFKVILCSREVAVKARTSALTLLIECCNANFRSSGKTRQGEEIWNNNNISENALWRFFSDTVNSFRGLSVFILQVSCSVEFTCYYFISLILF